jgi:hypothetical protein
MPLARSQREGFLVVDWRRPPPGLARRMAEVAAVGGGLLLLLTPLLPPLPRGAAALLPAAAVAALLVLAFRLLAAASRRAVTRSSLHVASGEVAVREGRGPFARERAFGVLEVDHVLLSRTGGVEDPTFCVSLVTRAGPAAAVTGDEVDEGACRDAAVLLAEGLLVPLTDRRYEAVGRGPPPRVALLGDARRRVFAWNYRDRLRPRALLLVLGALAAAGRFLPALAPVLGPALVVPAAAVVVVALGACAHLVTSAAGRRLTLLPDAVRVARSLGGVTLASRTVPFERVAAVLAHPRGPFASLTIRRDDRRPAAVLPFEEPCVAGWLKGTIEGAVHDAARSGAVLPAGG